MFDWIGDAAQALAFAALWRQVLLLAKIPQPMAGRMKAAKSTGRSLITTPPRPGRWQGIRLSPFHGTKRTCSLAGCGAAPHKPLVKTRGGG